MKGTVTVRIPESTQAKAEPIAELMGLSLNRFAEKCVTAIISLTETKPAERRVPSVVAAYDAYSRPDLLPKLPPESPISSTSAGAEMTANLVKPQSGLSGPSAPGGKPLPASPNLKKKK